MPPLVVLLRSCSEGDNTPEAVEMAQAVNASLEILPRGGGEGASVASLAGFDLVWSGILQLDTVPLHVYARAYYTYV